ncbi:MAG: GNAT family N-acetyltransferase [Phycisphaeraceae bacterium]|nr:GNAT family N-acetyltransferase [Phycisphaeraceae bacterium]MCW5763339.1 GNAT family N-acetyltransferase [Phycisphaeraceae bacterium]
MGDQAQDGFNPASIVPAGANFELRAITEADKPWIERTLIRYWASTSIYSRGKVTDASTLSGFGAFRDEEPIGLVTYLIDGDSCEIVTHNSMAGSGGIGTCLLAAVRQEARDRGCRRLWLATTNDNIPALKFYQRRDFDLVALYHNVMTDARKLKPEIPDVGLFDIPLRHELELEFLL